MMYIFSIILMILYNLYFVTYFNRLFPRREKPLWILIVCLVATIIIYTFVDKSYPTLIFSLILSVIFLMIRVTTSLGYCQSFFVASLIVLNANCMRNILNSFASMWILGGKLIVSESNMYNLISIITFIIALLTFILIRNMLDLDTKFKTFMNLKESIVFSNFYQIFACIQLCII